MGTSQSKQKGSKKSKRDAPLFVGFDGAVGEDQDADALRKGRDAVAQGQSIVFEIRDYKDDGELIRKAMADSSEEGAALARFREKVLKMNQWQAFADTLKNAISAVGERASAAIIGDRANHPRIKSLVDNFASLLDLAYTIDAEKMKANSLMNEFSFFKRLTSKRANPDEMGGLTPENMMAVSQFLTNTKPMTSAAVAGLQTALKNAEERNVLVLIRDILESTMEQCRHETGRCSHALALAIVLFDHLDTAGAFHRKSPMKVEAAVETIRKTGIEDTEEVLSAIKFWSKNFRSASTAKSVASALA